VFGYLIILFILKLLCPNNNLSSNIHVFRTVITRSSSKEANVIKPNLKEAYGIIAEVDTVD
jgi:hypothetical protein